MDNLTLTVVLTAGGAVTAAAVTRQLVELVKRAFPVIDARISGASLAFTLTGVLYVVAFVTVGEHTPDGAFIAFLSWLSCATSAIGINATLDHRAAGAVLTSAPIEE